MTGHETVFTFEEFKKYVKERPHWYIDTYHHPPNWGEGIPSAVSVRVILTGLDKYKNVVRYSEEIGTTTEGAWDKMMEEEESLRGNAKEKIEHITENVFPDMTEGIWRIS